MLTEGDAQPTVVPVAEGVRIQYPRRRWQRFILQHLSRFTFSVLTDLQVIGRENLPPSGPLLVVANHFNFADPAALVGTMPWPLEFIGGFQTPNAPPVARIIQRSWGIYPVFRGTGSRFALQAAVAVLKQRGVLGIFPEGGSWAQVLRPARPGAAFLASQSGAPILPIGLEGFSDIFPSLRRRRRAKVAIRIGEPFGPVNTTGSGRERRAQLEVIGRQMMERIAELLSPGLRGHFSDDPAIRAAAAGTEIWPWSDMTEG